MTPAPAAPPRLAYLNSQYPMLSMIFVIREVLQLRRMGFEIGTVSINAPDRPTAGMTAEEAAESSKTFYLKPQGLVGALRANFRQIRRRPRAWCRGCLQALRLAACDLSALVYNLLYFVEAVMVVDWMDAHEYTHLHAHLGSQAATVGLLAKTVSGCGYSITVHGPDEFYDAYRQYLPQKVAAADFIVCISCFARSQLMKLSPYSNWGKLEVSRLGVDTSAFRPAQKQARDGGFEILCVGRLTPAKGQHVLIEAVQRLHAQGRAVRLRLVGTGGDGPSLQRQVQDLGLEGLVIFEGAVNQDRIRALYSNADAFCIPSFAEGIPVVLMEAMSMQIPCVTTRITGIPELIDDGISGLLVAASDVEGLVEALARLIDDPALAVEIGRRARDRVCRDYELARNVAMLSDIFVRRVIDRNRSARAASANDGALA